MEPMSLDEGTLVSLCSRAAWKRQDRYAFEGGSLGSIEATDAVDTIALKLQILLRGDYAGSGVMRYHLTAERESIEMGEIAYNVPKSEREVSGPLGDLVARLLEQRPRFDPDDF